MMTTFQRLLITFVLEVVQAIPRLQPVLDEDRRCPTFQHRFHTCPGPECPLLYGFRSWRSRYRARENVFRGYRTVHPAFTSAIGSPLSIRRLGSRTSQSSVQVVSRQQI